MSIKKTIATLLGAATLVAGLATPAISAMPLNVPERPATVQPQSVDVRIGFYVSGGRGFYNGYRGYRHHRPGYRIYNGFWFPYSAFTIAPRPYYRERAIPGRISPAHIDWCHDRYRSYRSYDNSWQPNNGPRRVCRSPYW